jgi:hypothetical protein
MSSHLLFALCERKVISEIPDRAGGHWRSHAGEIDCEQQRWDTETYNHWLQLIGKERDQPDEQLLSGLAVSPCCQVLVIVFSEPINLNMDIALY